MITVGSRWLAPNMTRFVVELTEEKDGETWVYYENNQGQKFGCLEAAFLHRFVKDYT